MLWREFAPADAAGIAGFPLDRHDAQRQCRGVYLLPIARDGLPGHRAQVRLPAPSSLDEDRGLRQHPQYEIDHDDADYPEAEQAADGNGTKESQHAEVRCKMDTTAEPLGFQEASLSLAARGRS
jgi:hypothetical protein